MIRDVCDLATVEALISDLPAYAEANHGLNAGDILHVFSVCQAGWVHSGNPKDPHAELTSLQHSNGYFDTLRVLRYTPLCTMFAKLLAARILSALGFDPGPFTMCVGSDHAGAAFSHAVATELGFMHDFAEKRVEETPGIRRQTFQDWNRFAIEPGQRVLQVEELMTTAGTFEAVRAGIRRKNPEAEFLPVGGVLIHRSNVGMIEKTLIVPVVHFNVHNWNPFDCPLCAVGSPVIREPKKHWAELTGLA